jgi:hypothetical protein
MSMTANPLMHKTVTSRGLPPGLASGQPPGLPVIARPGISWAAALGGAVVAAAISIMLIALGSGLGFAAVSPYSFNNPSVMTFTVVGAIWLIIVQWVSAFFGGYLAGRLRPALTDVHTDEVGFRDTATGFVAWAVATLFVVALAAAGGASVVSGAGRAATAMAAYAAGGAAQGASVGPAQGGAAQAGSMSGGAPSEYLLDMLFRPAQPNAQGSAAEAKAEAGRILATGAIGDLSQPDHDYLVQLVASQTGLTPSDAGERVDDVIVREKQAVDKAKQAADAARKAASAFSIYTAVSMLIGAFIACVAGAIGGRQRDAY